MSRLTATQRQANRDLRRAELAGLRVVRRATRELYLRALSAFESRRRNVSTVSVEREVVSALTRTMEISALVGQRRAEIDYARGAGVSLSLDSLHDVFKAIKKPKKKPARNVIDLRQEYRKLAKKAGGKAVAKISESLLGRVNTLIDDGALLKTARREIRKTLQSAGAYGADDYLLNTLFRTHSQIATQGAYWQELEDHPTLWGYLYSTADDERVRPGHALLDGTTLPIGHKLWRKIAPPNGYNCRCYVIPLFDAEPVVKPKKGWSVDPGFETNWGTMFARISQAA